MATLTFNKDNYVSDYVMNCQFRNLISCVNLPTRITESSSTCLDHIWSSISIPNISGALQTDVTDHFPVFVCYPGYFAPNKGCRVKYCKRTDAQIERFISEVKKIIVIFSAINSSDVNMLEVFVRKCIIFIIKVFSYCNQDFIRKENSFTMDN